MCMTNDPLEAYTTMAHANKETKHAPEKKSVGGHGTINGDGLLR
jgi:hypothetical protein